MNLLPKKVEFDRVWSDLRCVTNAFVTGQGQLCKSAWKDRFSNVFFLCIAEPKSLGQQLYRELRTYFEHHVTCLCQQIQNAGDENLLTEYFKHWQTYSAAVPYLNQLYGYLNIHTVRKHKYCRVNIDFSPYGIEYDDEMLEIGELALNVWEHKVVRVLRDQLLPNLLKQIEKDRTGNLVNHSAVQGVIQSFITVRKFSSTNKLQLYEEVFELAFFKESCDFFARESQRLRDTSDCSTFVTKVARFLSDEAVRSQRYLHESSHQRILLDCQMRLLADVNVDFINSNCRPFVRHEQWNDLAAIYRLLSPLEDKLGILQSEFDQHLRDTGIALIQSLLQTGETSTTKFVETLLQFHSTYKEHIVQAFNSQASFLSALDKAFSAVINYKYDSKSGCKSPELLSRYCDELLHKGVKGLSETEIDDKLNHIVTLFNYLEDRDIFERFYARSLAKRLIFEQSQSMDMEEAMINKLKHVSGYEYTNKLHRMFTDMAISSDLNTKFMDFLQASGGRLAHAFRISVLQAGAWPISQTSLSFYLPQQLEGTVQMFERFYNSQFSGRKLTWLHNLSHVELRILYCQRPYMVSTDMYMMAILSLFNDADSLSGRDIKDATQLPDVEVLNHLQLLTEAKLLIASGPVSHDRVFKLNFHYKNKRTKFKLQSVTPTEVNQEVVQTRKAAEGDRSMLLQATIGRIMKARKELAHSALIDEVMMQTKARFTPRISDVKKCIDILMDKQYIQRAQRCPDNYEYVA